MLFSNVAWAQGKQVSGRVTDAKDGAALPGVTVKAKGAASSTITGNDGTFTLTVPESTTILIFSFVGYAEREVPISADMNITLSVADKTMAEVVVVGYGTKIKREVTSSIARVTSKEFENQPLPSFEQALQGRAAGVFINAGSGKLGQGLNIRIRGIASISAGTQPLIVIDGVPVTNNAVGTEVEADNPLASLNPDDIASMDVLKDAASAAIYGARGSNGVIIVTTKSGRAGRTKINFNVSHGFSEATRMRKFLNAAQYKELIGTAFKNRFGLSDADLPNFWNSNLAAPGLDEWNGGYDENWNERGFQKGYVSNYAISITGGDARTKFLFSGNYNKQKGIVLGNQLARATARINLDHAVTDKFKLGTIISLFRTSNQRIPNDNAFSNPVQLNALPPIQPAYLPSGELNDFTIYYNNLIEQKYAFNDATGFKTISSVYGEYELIPGLKLRSQAGVDFTNYQEEQYNGRETQDGAPQGQAYASQSTDYVFTSTTTLNYNKAFGDIHKLDLTGGTEYIKSSYRNVASTGENFPNSRFTKLANSSKITAGTSSETGYTFLSYFLRGNYVLADKYLLSASMRVDGSSRFGSDTRYGFFPAASLGWVISEENFLNNSKLLSFLKLRVSYGKTGNAEINNFASRTLVTSAAYADLSGLVVSQLGDPGLTWEKTDQFDIGIDYGFFDNRITGEIDYFHKNTTDLLLNVPLPNVNGFNGVVRNFGSMRNTGFEFVINSRNLVGAFKWNTSFNISTYKNEITRLVSPISPTSRNLSRLEVGQPFGQFYGFKYMGVDPANGNALYLAADGKTTVAWNTPQSGWGNFILGDPNPDFYGGINNNFSYKGFDLDVQCQFVYGNDLFNTGGLFQSSNGRYLDNQTIDQLNYWKQAGQITNIPRPIYGRANGTETSSRWIEDGSYFRVKSVNFGYNIPTRLIKRFRMSNAKVYMAASNLFTFTNYSGYDPEVTSGATNAINIGHDFYTPPQIKTITFGLNVGF
jgi:TonB-linked SusC/RagA family outer membrane protein